MQAVLKDRGYSDLLLAILLATDILFIFGYVLFLSTSYVHDSNYDIMAERGFGETFQYIKAYWLVLLFALLSYLTRERAYLAWFAVFTYLGADDLFEIHEEGGNSIAVRYDFPELFGLRARDLGELTIFAAAGIVLAVIVGIAYLRGSDTFKDRSIPLIIFSGLLIGAGIVVDAVHIPLDATILNRPLTVLEDGGEMIILSVVCWYVFRLIIPVRQIESDTAELPAFAAHQREVHQPQHASSD